MSRLIPIIGTEIVDDIRLGHTWYEYGRIKNILNMIYPKTFIEVGVHEGGLSYLLLQERDFADIEFVGIEINCGLVRPEVKRLYSKRLKSKLICGDCFDLNLFEALSNKEHKIIYCDGGNKAEELVHFKSALCHGDYIFAHDYWDGRSMVAHVPKSHISWEVKPKDVEIFDDPNFTRVFKGELEFTRIIGWRFT